MSINIDIDGEWGLKSSTDNFILGKWHTVTDKEGKEVTKLGSRTYPNTLSNAFKSYKRRRVQNSSAESFEELAELVKQLDDKIEGITKELGV